MRHRLISNGALMAQPGLRHYSHCPKGKANGALGAPLGLSQWRRQWRAHGARDGPNVTGPTDGPFSSTLISPDKRSTTMDNSIQRANSNMADDVERHAGWPGAVGVHHHEARDVSALLQWMMRDRVINCQCRPCAARRIMLSAPERIAKRIGATLTPRDIDAINDELAGVICEIAESDLKHADDDIPF